MSEIHIQDNFLNRFQFQEMKNKLLSPEFNWQVGQVIREGTTNIDPVYNIQITHILYHTPTMVSDSLPIIAPLLAQLNMHVLLRAKINSTFASKEIVEHGLHIDIEPYELAEHATTGIFYLNNNDGYSIFEDGTKIETVENRLVTFPATMRHSGTSCTNVDRRVVLNLNYIASKNA